MTFSDSIFYTFLSSLQEAKWDWALFYPLKVVLDGEASLRLYENIYLIFAF